MPAGDRTGPEGQGPMTGRAAGYCAGYDSPGNMNSTVKSRRYMAYRHGNRVGRRFAESGRGRRGRRRS